MRKARFLADARRGDGLIVKKDNRNKGSSTAFQRFKCSYVASECEDKVQALEEKMGSLHTELKGLRTEVSAMHKGASAWWSNADKHCLQEPFKKKLASLQEEIKGLRADTTASLRDTSSIRADLCTHTTDMEILFSRVQSEMSKGHKEHQDLGTRVNAQTEFMSADLIVLSQQVGLRADGLEKKLIELRAKMDADVASLIAMDEQLDNKMDRIQEEITGLRADNKMDRIQEEITGLRADMAKADCHMKADPAPVEADLASSFVNLLQEYRAVLKADMAKADCHTEVDVASSFVMLHKKIDLMQEHIARLSADMSKMGSMDRLQEEITGLRADMAENCQMLSKTMCEAIKHLRANMADQFSAIEGDAITGKVQKDLLNKMHAEMERLCGVVATMNGNANGVWSNVIAQEKQMHKLMHMLSNVESYTTDKEHANVVLVKVVTVFLACTTAIYAWMVWSFNSCYPF